jgi:hypothetical protein
MAGLDPATQQPRVRAAEDIFPMLEASERNGQWRLAFIRLVPDEPEALRQRPLERSQARKRSLTARIPPNLETASAGDDHLDVIAFLQFQGIDHGLREANRKAVSPLGNSHRGLLK